ncbi:hemolysin-III related-domain-containing protein [Lineolata rhizophorae]|uniref:Hemolysin-III related-domain-containing protein n=1 Tax=Lineolata rhizophorae TaxID=578093 RepID=A0A6A6NLA4_9PEZI|nr:hemolysin-III related-domain-containing protein [Lineolata rhizophorae]
MACTATSVVMEPYEEPVLGSSSAQESREQPRRRRHSSYHIRRRSVEHDNIQILVDGFLSELSRRLDFLESYGHLKLDAGIERAYATLHAVRDSCARVSDNVIGAGRKRASVLVETLEGRYKEVLARKDTMEQKVQEGVRLMDNILVEFEARAYTMRGQGIRMAAHELYDEGKRRVDEGIERAREVVDEGIERARRAKDRMRDKVEKALDRAREHGLIRYDDLPDPWKINPHIIHGYRFHEGKLDCLRSVLSVSNELVNIWSHAIGLLVVLSVAFYFYPTSMNFTLSTKSDVFVAAVFFFAACKCLVCSTMWHAMNSIADQTLMERFACVDYTGISLLVAASIMTSEYTAFYCEPMSRWTYMVTTAALGIGGVILPWHPTFNRFDMAWARVCFYVSLSATGFLPVFQLILTRGLPWALYFYAPVAKSILVYLTGAILYAAKVPEKWFPGMFDYVGGSHNLWHLAVLGGILFHYLAMQDFFAQAFSRARNECSAY